MRNQKKITQNITNWLETKWVNPAYSGWLLIILAIFFFGAATNTMAGWLYVMSGVSIALLTIAAILPVRSLRQISINRQAISPISAGDTITIEIEIQNKTNQPKTLLQIKDILPFVLNKKPETTNIEIIPPWGNYQWIYYQNTQKRGVYRWHEIQIRTATPFGLFWCRRSWEAKAKAIVYPQVLPLNHCPLIDDIGEEETPLFYNRDRIAQQATQGMTRTLRPYRWGDPFRLIHWRTSARYGELRVRELEIFTGGQEIIIGLDSANPWNSDNFEQAVIAAASLYFYAHKNQVNVKLWTAATELIQGHQVVLETLAAVNPQEEISKNTRQNYPLIWLTENPETINTLATGSRWILWPKTTNSQQISGDRHYPGITIQPDRPLEQQLQLSVRF